MHVDVLTLRYDPTRGVLDDTSSRAPHGAAAARVSVAAAAWIAAASLSATAALYLGAAERPLYAVLMPLRHGMMMA